MKKIIEILFFATSIILLLVVIYNKFFITEIDDSLHPEHAGLKTGIIYLVNLIVRSLLILIALILLIYSLYKKRVFYINSFIIIVALLLSFS